MAKKQPKQEQYLFVVGFGDSVPYGPYDDEGIMAAANPVAALKKVMKKYSSDDLYYAEIKEVSPRRPALARYCATNSYTGPYDGDSGAEREIIEVKENRKWSTLEERIAGTWVRLKKD